MENLIPVEFDSYPTETHHNTVPVPAEGKKLYIGNCHNFNYGDFEAYVPNSICEKHGIHKIDANMTDIEVNFDTDLVDEMAVLGEDE